MALSSTAYRANFSEEPGAFSGVGMSFGIGALTETVGFGRGREITGLSKGGLFGGGWRNRFVLGAKQGSLEAVGLEMRGIKSVFGEGALRRWGGRLFMGGFTAYSMYEGYQHGGVLGAIKGGIREVAVFGAMRVVGEVAGASVLGSLATPIAIGATAGYGAYKALEYGQSRTRALRETEFITPVTDPYGTGYTMRQRSLASIQKSYLNGRMAMGNEAVLLGAGRGLR